MAEKPGDQKTIEEMIAQAKELLGRGTRNYVVNAYADASEDLSQACSIYADLYGPNADELGKPYLIYAKSLIAVAQDENRLMDIPEEDEDEPDDEDGEPADEEKVDEEKPEENDQSKKEESSVKETTEESATNGQGQKSEVDSSLPSTSSTSADSSSSQQNGLSGKEDIQTEETEEDDESAASLQVAWEVLELAVQIFERQGNTANLADAYAELANISFENSFFEIAISDYNKSFDKYTDLPEPNRRILAELKYKVGLCYTMLNDFENAIISLKEACNIFDDEIEAEKIKTDAELEEKENNIKDLEETKQEIQNKIIEIEESKQQSIEEVKKELAKLIGTEPTISNGAGGSSSSSSTVTVADNLPKPSDISHLIKRKKPEVDTTDAEAAPPPTKKPSI